MKLDFSERFWRGGERSRWRRSPPAKNGRKNQVSIYQENFKEKGRAGENFGAPFLVKCSFGHWLPIHENRVVLSVVDREKIAKQNRDPNFFGNFSQSLGLTLEKNRFPHFHLPAPPFQTGWPLVFFKQKKNNKKTEK